MPSAWINTRKTSNGEERFHVKYRLGGRGSKHHYAGCFRDRRAAQLRQEVILAELAQHHDPKIAAHVRIEEKSYAVFGRVWKLKYRDENGENVSVVIGRECDGYTRRDADEAASRFVLSQQNNPLNALLNLADSLVAKQERRLGEALPHLYVAQTQIRQLHRLASLELAANPTVFDEQDRIDMQTSGVAS